jgi:hypothetical protein
LLQCVKCRRLCVSPFVTVTARFGAARSSSPVPEAASAHGLALSSQAAHWLVLRCCRCRGFRVPVAGTASVTGSLLSQRAAELMGGATEIEHRPVALAGTHFRERLKTGSFLGEPISFSGGIHTATSVDWQ